MQPMDKANPERYSFASIAIAGVSRKSTKFGASAYRTLKKRGYRLFPIHPTLEAFDGDTCFRSVADIRGEVDWVWICLRPEHALTVVDDAHRKGIPNIWFQQGADFSQAAARARELGLRVVTGRCILMYTEPVTGIHAIHRFLSRLFGKY